MSSTKKAKASKVQGGSKAQAAVPAKPPAKPPVKTAAKPAAKAAAAKIAKAKAQAGRSQKPAVQKPKAPAAKAVKTAKAGIKASKEPSTAAPKPAIAMKHAAAKAAPRLPAALKALSGAQTPVPAPRSQVRAAQQKPEKKLTARPPSAPVVLTPDYRPSENEPFMSELHRAYFRQKLMNWKDEINRQTKETLVVLHEDSVQHADIADRATSETDRSLELRARDRQRKLIAKIDAALARLDDGSYGYCEETGEPIGLKRLDARPIATLSLEAQERHERREKVYRED